MSFSEYFHHISKGLAGPKGLIPIDPKEWPEEWKTIYYKTYPDLEKIALPDALIVDAKLSDTIAGRASSRRFAQTPLTIGQYSTLLKYTCGLQREVRQEDKGDGPIAWHHRAQPSGGARYPIEAYVVNFVPHELPAGVYHYGVKDHALTVLQKRAFDAADIGELFTYDYAQKASSAIVLTGAFERTAMKYGERGYRYVLLEAGHIGQNVSLVSQALGLGSVMMGGSRDEALEKLLDIDGVSESVVYSMIVG